MERKKGIISIILVTCLLLGITGCDTGGVESPGDVVQDTGSGQEERKSDEPIRPQDDYYGYVNKETLEGLKVHYSDYAVGPTVDQEILVQDEIHTMILEIVNSNEEYEPGSNEQLVKDTYEQMLMYLDKKESNAKNYYLEIAKQIQVSDNMEDIKDNFHLLMSEGMISYFDVSVDHNYYDGENYALYFEQKVSFCNFRLKDIYEKDETRQALHAYATEVLVSTGVSSEEASKKAEDFVYFMIDLACDTDYSVLEASNPFLTFTVKKNSDMNQILKGIKNEEVQEIYELDNPYGSWIIQDEEQIASLSAHFTQDNIENLKLYMLCDLMYTYKDFLQEDFLFLESNAIQITKEKDQMASYFVSNLLGREISELYAKYYYTEEMDIMIHQMYDDIIASYDELITEATWLTEDTRKDLLDKLHNMYFVSGGGTPHERKAEDANVIGKDAFDTMVNLNKRKIQSAKGNIGKKIEKGESSMYSHIVNSQYSVCNTFTITVAIMHAPYFDVNADYATNMGGLGMVMAHEIGHAFDSNCIAYDANGVYHPDRISKQDQEQLAIRLKQMEDYYSGFAIMDIYHVDGEKTSGENYADKGAMECLMNLFHTREEQEKLFENYAYIWCMLTEDSVAIDNLMEDEHSPNEVRVNAVLSSTKEFYDLYDVQKGDGMYIEPDKRVSRWK